jgi:hypothetical protein
MSAPTFQVTLHDFPGNTITIPSTSHTPLTNLIETFREVVPNSKKKRIILTWEDRRLKRGTLGDNGIHNTVTLFVIYTENTACIDPEPITPYLYEWIEEGHILLYDPTHQEQDEQDEQEEPEPILIPMADIPLPHRPKTYHADCTELLAEYNEWTIGEEYRFFLTDAPPRVQRSFPWYRFENTVEKNRIIRYVPFVGPDFPLNITLYQHGIPSDSHDLMWLGPFSSVKGTLHSIKLHVTIKPLPAPTHGDYECKYHFNVFLKGPIEIRDDRGVFVDSFNKEVVCMIKYDQIVTCDDRGPMIPDAVASAVEEAVATEVANANAVEEVANRNQGGRRSRSKSKPKRKTRRTKRRV